jgi:hypothetical protein
LGWLPTVKRILAITSQETTPAAAFLGAAAMTAGTAVAVMMAVAAILLTQAVAVMTEEAMAAAGEQ